MSLSPCRVFRRVQCTRVIVGEISTAYGGWRWYGRGEDAPHGIVAVVWIERLEGGESNCCIVMSLAYIIT